MSWILSLFVSAFLGVLADKAEQWLNTYHYKKAYEKDVHKTLLNNQIKRQKRFNQLRKKQINDIAQKTMAHDDFDILLEQLHNKNTY